MRKVLYVMILLLLLCPSLALAQEATTQSVPIASSSNSGGYVYRFWSDVFKGHFFTSSVDEANKVNDTDKNWKYESIAFNAFNSQESGSIPLYRFWSDKFHGHFYTADASEMAKVRDTDGNWAYEKIAFYVYPLTYTGDSKIVYRFWSPVFSHHFYTADEGEMARVRDTDKNWVYEGPAYRVPNTLDNNSTNNNSNNNQNQSSIINKNVGEDLILSSIKLRINSSREEYYTSSDFGTKRASNDAKFVVVDMDVTNITKKEFSFFPEYKYSNTDLIYLIDGQQREFNTYENSIMYVPNDLNVRELSPSIKENGVLVFEIPKDSNIYSLKIINQISDQEYRISLK